MGVKTEAILSFSEIPVSFTGKALFFADRNRWLGFRGLWPSDGLPVELLAKVPILTIYAIGTGILCAPLGVIYHGASALRQKAISMLSSPSSRSHSDALAWEHFKAMLIDISGIALVFFGLLYVANEAGSKNSLRWWWFSSTPVRTEYVGPPLAINVNRRNSHSHRFRLMIKDAKLYWGEGRISGYQCPYQRMRFYAVKKWREEGEKLDLNDPQILLSISLNGFKPYEFIDRHIPIRVNKSAFLSGRYACLEGKEKPDGVHNWKASLTLKKVAQIAGKIFLEIVCLAIFIKTCSIVFRFGLSGFLWDLASLSQSPAWILPLRICRMYLCLSLCSGISLGISLGILLIVLDSLTLLEAVASPVVLVNNKLRQDCAFEELKLFHSLLERPLELKEGANRDNQESNYGENAFFWLKTAASRGHRSAQRILGLSLIAGVAQAEVAQTPEGKERKENALRQAHPKEERESEDDYHNRLNLVRLETRLERMDDEMLAIIHEGVTWLQAAARNRDMIARDILDSLFLWAPDRLFRGVRGDSKTERTRSFLEGINLAPAIKPFSKDLDFPLSILVTKPARRRLLLGIAAARKRIYSEAIGKAIAELDQETPGSQIGARLFPPKSEIWQLIVGYLAELDQELHAL